MSYDLRLQSPSYDAISREDEISKEIEAGIFEFDPITDEQLAFNRRLAAKLVEFNPIFEVIEMRNGKAIEVRPPQNSNSPISIGIYKHEVAMSVPYWYRGADVETIFREIWKYLKFIQQETAYEVFDTQIDSVIDLTSEEVFTEVLETYNWTMEMIDQTIRSNLPPNTP